MDDIFINAAIDIEDGNGEEWTLKVDSDGDVEIEAPCGTSVTLKCGKKGKFFSDFVRGYKKLATLVGIYDSKLEIGDGSRKPTATNLDEIL